MAFRAALPGDRLLRKVPAFTTLRKLAVAAVIGSALLAAVVLVASQVGGERDANSLLSVIGPGTHLELQTSSGPMSLTVDSAMDNEGYVHAHGIKNGVTYAGYVKLTTSNTAALQSDEASPSAQRLAVYNQQQQQQSGGGEGIQVLAINSQGAVTINGEPVVAANTRTASVLRLLAKQAEEKSGGIMNGGASQLGREIDRSSTIVSRLGENRRSARRGSQGSKQAIWSAMQSLMKTVSKIEERQDKMGKTVDRVRRVMRYRP